MRERSTSFGVNVLREAAADAPPQRPAQMHSNSPHIVHRSCRSIQAAGLTLRCARMEGTIATIVRNVSLAAILDGKRPLRSSTHAASSMPLDVEPLREDGVAPCDPLRVIPDAPREADPGVPGPKETGETGP